MKKAATYVSLLCPVPAGSERQSSNSFVKDLEEIRAYIKKYGV
jgi:hypothetical protein